MQVMQVKTMDHRSKTIAIYKGTFIHSESKQEHLDGEWGMLYEIPAKGAL